MDSKKLLVSDYDGTFYISDLDIKKTIGNINNFNDEIDAIPFYSNIKKEGAVLSE